MTPPLRLRPALALATTMHLLASLPVLAVGRTGNDKTVDEVLHEISLDLAPPPRERDAPPSDAPTEAHALAEVSPLTNITPAARTREGNTASLPDSDAPRGGLSVADAAWSFDPLRRPPSDLGLGSHWKTVAAAGAADVNEGAAHGGQRNDARAVDRSIRDALAARDTSLGLGRTGPLVSAVHQAASATGAPAVGATTLEVECDERGIVIAARADDRAWAHVADAVVSNMKGKKLRVARGARGIRARLRVVAEHALPSGTHGSSNVGAVPDDAPGGSKACEGEGITRRCVAGMPLGATNAQHDTSNLCAAASRIVRVQLLGESEL